MSKQTIKSKCRPQYNTARKKRINKISGDIKRDDFKYDDTKAASTASPERILLLY